MLPVAYGKVAPAALASDVSFAPPQHQRGYSTPWPRSRSHPSPQGAEQIFAGSRGWR
jgi:hypothetical protein